MLEVRIKGEGVSRDGFLSFEARMNLKGTRPPEVFSFEKRGTKKVNSTVVVPPTPSATPASRPSPINFLNKFNLGPPQGFQNTEEVSANEGAPKFGQGGLADAPAMKARMKRRECVQPVCETDLSAVSDPITLFTKPPCTINLYSNVRELKSKAPAGRVRALPMFAICLTSPACAKKKVASQWEQLKNRLVPLLLQTGFNMIPAARSALPRRLDINPGTLKVVLPGSVTPQLPLKRLGDEAFAQGDYWQAVYFYSARLDEMGDECTEELPKVLSNRAASLAKLNDYEQSLADARRATELSPKWSRPWSRVGLAAWRLGEENEALDAYTTAVELEATGWKQNVSANLDALHKVAAKLVSDDADAAHAAKEKGNEAMRTHELGLAVAMYTHGIARLPPTPRKPKDDSNEPEDPHALLRAVLFSNRCAALSRLQCWDAAIQDGRDAVSAQPAFIKGRIHLAVALLGRGFYEQAYLEFGKAAQIDQEDAAAQKGRKACMLEITSWTSIPARVRFHKRTSLDLKRPPGTTRVFAISDIHFDHKANEEWAHLIDDFAFQDDVLIVAGNVADTKGGVVRGLTTLMGKFRRVFYTVGNHEMWIHHSEFAKYPDSVAKLFSIFEACDELGVDVFPAAVCEGVFIVPLLSWYTAEFDLQDPFPNPRIPVDAYCKWPMDKDLQVWKYMVRLNEVHLRQPYLGTVITFSHFVPRQGFPYSAVEAGEKGTLKSMGCEMIDDQLREVNSKLHVYGHTHKKYAMMHANVRYVHQYLGFEHERATLDTAPGLMMVYNGRNVCMQEWGADGMAPMGFIKRVAYLNFYAMEKAPEKSDQLRRLQNIVTKFGKISGIKATFDCLGSAKERLGTQEWPEMKWTYNGTHGLMVIADDPKALKALLNSETWSREWLPATTPLTRSSVNITTTLRMDLQCDKKEDPVVIFYLLRLKPEVTEESEAYAKLESKVALLANLQGAKGKIDARLATSGHMFKSQSQLCEEIGIADDKSFGLTHCFTMFADAPASYKLVAKSKTYEKWKKEYEPLLDTSQQRGPALFTFAIPLDIKVDAAAPHEIQLRNRRTRGTASKAPASRR